MNDHRLDGHPLTMSVPGGMDLGCWGRLQVVDRQRLAVTVGAARRELEVGDVMEASADLVGWFDPAIGVLLLGGRGPSLVRIDLPSDTVDVVAELEREEDEDLRHLSFHGLNGSVVCLFEQGVVCLDVSGNLRWQATHEDLSAEFKGVRDGAVWFASQWPPDRVGYRFAFRLTDGKKVFG
jgi:hypothetical protein